MKNNFKIAIPLFYKKISNFVIDIFQNCEKVKTTEEMTCLTPYIDITLFQRRRRSEQESKTPFHILEFGFKLDNIQSFIRFGNFSIYPDPEFILFDASTKPFQGKTNDYLTINVSNLMLVYNNFRGRQNNGLTTKNHWHFISDLIM